MSINRFAVISILVLLTFAANIYAQTPAVTASVTPDGNVRMIAHGEALQVRMEIYPAGGELVADTGLREGNVFTNQEQEQMRITPEGRVRIGTKTPEATLDVAGTIKTTGGIQFEDGSVLNTAKGLPTKEAPGGAGGAALR